MKGGKKLHITPDEIKVAATLPRAARCRDRNRHRKPMDEGTARGLLWRQTRDAAKTWSPKVKH